MEMRKGTSCATGSKVRSELSLVAGNDSHLLVE